MVERKTTRKGQIVNDKFDKTQDKLFRDLLSDKKM